MGAAASMPAARAGAWEAGLPHAARVTRLYRASLRTSRDWLIDREVWMVDAARIQAAFHSQKGVSMAAGRVLADRAAETLIEHRHPEPYVPIYMEGGRYVGDRLKPNFLYLSCRAPVVRAAGGVLPLLALRGAGGGLEVNGCSAADAPLVFAPAWLGSVVGPKYLDKLVCALPRGRGDL